LGKGVPFHVTASPDEIGAEQSQMTTLRYNPISRFLKERFGCRVFKVSLNAGLTCPNRDGTKGIGGCIYCQPSTLIPFTYSYGMTIKEQLKRGMDYIRRRHKAERFIAYFQINTNTYAPLKVLEGLYREAIEEPDVVGLAISTRPDCVDDKVMGLLSELSQGRCLWLELGLQSSKDRTLGFINRGHTVKDFEDAVEMARERDIPVCAHIILGLPGETREDMLDTARFLARLNIWGVKVHNIQVHKGTRLEDMYKKGEFLPIGLDEYISLVVDILEVLPPDTLIHRLSGDTPRRFLVAPEWANKGVILEKIHRLMEERETYQGVRYGRL